MNDASVISDNYRRVAGNIYAVLNDPGVVIVYKERRMKDEKYVWVDTSAPEIKKINGQTSSGDNRPKEDHKDPSPKISRNNKHAAGKRWDLYTNGDGNINRNGGRMGNDLPDSHYPGI